MGVAGGLIGSTPTLEELIFVVLPCVAFLLVAFGRVIFLLKQQRKTIAHANSLRNRNVKVFLASLLAIAQFIGALQRLHSVSQPSSLSFAASVLLSVSFIGVAGLSWLEHNRSIRPSSLIVFYLLFSAFFDFHLLRNLWFREETRWILLVRVVICLLKLAIVISESHNKRHFLERPYRDLPPESLAGMIARLFFWWVLPTLKRGYSNVLQPCDLPPLDPGLSGARLLHKLSINWERHRWSSTKHRLLLATLRCFRGQLLSVLPLRVLAIACRFSQPVLISKAINVMNDSDISERRHNGLSLAMVTLLLYGGIAINTAAYKHKIYQSMVAIRSGMVAKIHEKSMSLEYSGTSDTAGVTLMSADVDQILAGVEVMDVIWATPIEIGLASFMLAKQLGLASLIPLAISLGSAIGSICIGSLAVTSQKSWIDSIQKRVTATAFYLENLKPIKMIGFTETVAHGLRLQRLEEIDRSRSYRKVDTAQLALGNASLIITPFVTFIVYHVYARSTEDRALDPAKALTSLSLIALLSYPMAFFAFAVPRFAGSIGCYTRIQEYLDLPEVGSADFTAEDYGDMDGTESAYGKDDVELESLLPVGRVEGQFQSYPHDWTNVPSVMTDNGGIRAPQDVLIQVEGANFSFPGSRAYALRELSLTIREEKFHLVNGPVGSGKSALILALLGELHQIQGSVYRKPSLNTAFCAQEPWLPDTSIRDAIVGPSLPDQGWLTEVIDVCNLYEDIQALQYKEETIIGMNGAGLSGGQRQRLAIARALYSRKEVLLLDDVLSGIDSSTEATIIQKMLGPHGFCRRHRLTVVMTAPTLRHAKYFDTIHFVASGFVSDNHEDRHTIADARKYEHCVQSGHQNGQSESNNTGNANMAQEPIRSTTGNGLPLYQYYFSMMGWWQFTMVLVSSAVFVFCYKFSNLWLKWWTEREGRRPLDPRAGIYPAVYGILSFLGLAALVSFSWSLKIVAAPRVALKMHQTLLETTSSASYGFLVSSGCGSIINRFGEDLTIVDMQLVVALARSVDGFFTVVAESFLVALASPFATTLFPPLAGAVIALQKIYLRTSRQIRLLEIELRAPLYSQFLQTLNGRATIRAFAWKNYSREKLVDALDRSQSALYINYAIQRWLGLVLDLIVAIIAVMVILLGTQLSTESSDGGALGLSLATIVTFSVTLSYFVQGWAQLETTMGAVQRVRRFVQETPVEARPNRDRALITEPFSRAVVCFDSVTAGYVKTQPPILKDVTLRIAAGQRVGVCGRTGSGKSTLLLAILGLMEMFDGEITINGVAISKHAPDCLRRFVTVIPQECIVLPVSVRRNLDPYNQHSETKILQALDRVGLLETFSEPGGLCKVMNSSGSALLSRGELQLFCLARAILQHDNTVPLVVMDEITSGIDPSTEDKIMEVVMDVFATSTIIAVAHRLHTIQNFDVVVVMDQGKIQEIGFPETLLKDNQSTFFKLYHN